MVDCIQDTFARDGRPSAEHAVFRQGQKPLRQSSQDLLMREEVLNTARLSGAAHYSPTQNIKNRAALIQLARSESTDASGAKNRPKLVA